MSGRGKGDDTQDTRELRSAAERLERTAERKLAAGDRAGALDALDRALPSLVELIESSSANRQ